MPQRQPRGGSQWIPVRLAAALGFGLAWSSRALLQVVMGKAASPAKEGDTVGCPAGARAAPQGWASSPCA